MYQTESGDLLLKVPTSPVTRYAENFDLSEDGSVAAVVNAGVIQVYKLPPPSEKDVKDLAEAKSFSPPTSQAPVTFARLESPESEDGAEKSPAGTDVAAEMKPDGTDAGSSPGLGGGGGSASARLRQRRSASRRRAFSWASLASNSRCSSRRSCSACRFTVCVF